MTTELSGKRIAFVATDGVEQVELDRGAVTAPRGQLVHSGQHRGKVVERVVTAVRLGPAAEQRRAGRPSILGGCGAARGRQGDGPAVGQFDHGP